MVKVSVKIKDDKYLEIFGDGESIYIRAKVVSDPLPLPKELHALRVIILATSATKSRRPSSLILI
jgi:hypothetical protein